MWMKTGEGVIWGRGRMWREVISDAQMNIEMVARALGVYDPLIALRGDLVLVGLPYKSVGMWKYQATWRLLGWWDERKVWCAHLQYGGSIRETLMLSAQRFGIKGRIFRVWAYRLPIGSPSVWRDNIGRIWRLREAIWVPRGCVCFAVEDSDVLPNETVAVPGRAYSGVGAAKWQREGAVVAVSEGGGTG